MLISTHICSCFLYVVYIALLLLHCYLLYTSSTAQGGGGSFKNRKPIGEFGCCESGMAERIHWWPERCLRSPLFLSLSLTIYLPTYLSSMYLSICLSVHRSIYLSTYPSIYRSICRSIYRSIDLICFTHVICLSIYLSVCLSIYLPVYLQAWKPSYSARCLHFQSWQHQKRSNSARPLHFSKLTTYKTQQFSKTSSIFAFDNIKIIAILRDFLQKWKVERSADSLVPMRFAIFPLHQSLKYCACHEKLVPGQTKCCTCHAKSS